MKKVAIFAAPIAITSAIIWFYSCGDAEKATPPSTDEILAPLPSQLILGGMGSVVPSGVAVTSPTASISSESMAELQAAGKLVLATSLLPEPNPQPAPQPPAGPAESASDYLSKVRLMESTLTATTKSACAAAIPRAFNLAQGGLGHAACFGTQLKFTEHPDTNPLQTVEFGGGDTGIRYAYSELDANSGQGCPTYVVNTLMDVAGDYTSTALGMQALVACAGRLDGVDLPELNATVDMTANLTEITIEDLTISSATITREANTADGKAVYLTDLTGVMTDRARSLVKDFHITVRHVPQNEENTAYKGAIQFTIPEFDPQSTPPRDAVISLKYDYDADGLRYRYRQHQTQDSSTAFSTTTYELNEPEDQSASSWQEIRVANDAFGFGRLVYVWITGQPLVFNAVTSADGTATAYFGHTSREDNPVGSDGFYRIDGFRCYAANPVPNNADPYKDFVQSQSSTFNATSKQWELTSSKIAFAPTVSCQWDGVTGGPLEWYKEQQGGAVWETVTGPITADLFPLADYTASWTAPIEPTSF